MTVYVVDIEAVDTRYTKQWKDYLPKQLSKHADDVVVISGGDVPMSTTPGAFLNFAGTNNYKSQQMLEISRLFASNEIKDGDYFLYTDAWNPTVIQLKYMAELLGITVKIGGMWHAGSYDPQDFLGRLIGDKPWVRYAEKSMFHVYDDNYFATEFHAKIFAENLLQFKSMFGMTTTEWFVQQDNVKIVGWPMEYLRDIMAPYKNMEKRDTIVFPHRLAPEKQLDIFKDLQQELPEYEFIVCQEQELTKNEYHNILGEAKIVFSANLQETLGISAYEAMLVGAIPMVPDRLSYTEMYDEEFKYPSEWTESWDSYKQHKKKVVERIRKYMKDYKNYDNYLNSNAVSLHENFFSGTKLYEQIKGETHA
jgi:glycosyltransferase involved in cell wall biosynthesis